MTCYEKDCHYVMTHDGDCFYEGLPMDKKENCPMYKAKTNADRIRAMTDEELGVWISALYTAQSLAKHDPHFWIDWLRQECSDG